MSLYDDNHSICSLGDIQTDSHYVSCTSTGESSLLELSVQTIPDQMCLQVANNSNITQ